MFFFYYPFSFFSSQKHNPCWTSCGSLGRATWSPTPSHSHHSIHSYRGDLAGLEPATSETVRQRSYLWATDLLLRHVKELLFHYLLVCDLCFLNKPVKAFSCVIWTQASITEVIIIQVTLKFISEVIAQVLHVALEAHGCHLCFIVTWVQNIVLSQSPESLN